MRVANSGGDERADTDKVVATNIGLINKQTIQVGPRWAVIGIFIILLGGALYLTASFTLPVVSALLFALVLSPIVRFARKRLHIPEAISAAVLVIGTLIFLIAGFYALSGPVTRVVMNAPEYAQAIDAQISDIRERFAQLERARDQVAEPDGTTVNGAAVNPQDPDAEAVAQDAPEEVVVRSPGLLDNAATTIPTIGASVVFALIFLFFLLASGSLFHQKLIEMMPTFSDKKRALSIAHEIERELSRYLLTITVINAGLGVAVGTALWWAGMPTPIVFGALAFVLNFIPYIGAIVGVGIAGVIALAEFGTLGQALVPVLLYFACTTIEGQLITPTVVGRRLEMNAAAVFLSVAFWGWIWGVVGMFLAVPIMVGVKVMSNYSDGLRNFGNFLSSDSPPPSDKSR